MYDAWSPRLLCAFMACYSITENIIFLNMWSEILNKEDSVFKFSYWFDFMNLGRIWIIWSLLGKELIGHSIYQAVIWHTKFVWIRFTPADHLQWGRTPPIDLGTQVTTLFSEVNEMTLPFKIKTNEVWLLWQLACRRNKRMAPFYCSSPLCAESIVRVSEVRRIRDETGRDGQVESVSPAQITISNKTSGSFADLHQMGCSLSDRHKITVSQKSPSTSHLRPVFPNYKYFIPLFCLRNSSIFDRKLNEYLSHICCVIFIQNE